MYKNPYSTPLFFSTAHVLISPTLHDQLTHFHAPSSKKRKWEWCQVKASIHRPDRPSTLFSKYKSSFLDVHSFHFSFSTQPDTICNFPTFPTNSKLDSQSARLYRPLFSTDMLLLSNFLSFYSKFFPQTRRTKTINKNGKVGSSRR